MVDAGDVEKDSILTFFCTISFSERTASLFDISDLSDSFHSHGYTLLLSDLSGDFHPHGYTLLLFKFFPICPEPFSL